MTWCTVLIWWAPSNVTAKKLCVMCSERGEFLTKAAPIATARARTIEIEKYQKKHWRFRVENWVSVQRNILHVCYCAGCSKNRNKTNIRFGSGFKMETKNQRNTDVISQYQEPREIPQAGAFLCIHFEREKRNDFINKLNK